METEAPGVIITFFAFIIGFSLLVFIHEWGHYRVGRLFGVKIETFSIGFGKELFGWTDKRGVRWKFCMLPLGGYVKFFGDRTAASDSIADAEYYSEDEKAVCFHFKPVWQRALIVFAGPAINLLAAIIVFAGFYYSGGIYYSEPVINDVVAESAAEEAGLTAGDRILAINSTNVDRFSDIMPLIRLYPGEQITVHIDRGGVLASIPVTLGTQYMEDRFGTRYPLGVLGVRSVPVQHKELGIGQSLVEGDRADSIHGEIYFCDHRAIDYGRAVCQGSWRTGQNCINDRGGSRARAGIADMVPCTYLCKPWCSEPVADSRSGWRPPFILFYRGSEGLTPVTKGTGSRFDGRICLNAVFYGGCDTE